jgi:hypothetical protein
MGKKKKKVSKKLGSFSKSLFFSFNKKKRLHGFSFCQLLFMNQIKLSLGYKISKSWSFFFFGYIKKKSFFGNCKPSLQVCELLVILFLMKKKDLPTPHY